MGVDLRGYRGHGLLNFKNWLDSSPRIKLSLIPDGVIALVADEPDVVSFHFALLRGHMHSSLQRWHRERTAASAEGL
jgi:hypothetical protein